MQGQIYNYLFATFAFVLGAVVGSFLNVCIYRMPLGLSVNEPRRSFCPHCKKQIPWYQNLPLFSWVLLRGKCAECGAPIAFRYFAIELLTALLFLAIWLTQPLILVFPYWILAALLIVATFIDFDHFIIPDEITWGSVGAGLVLSFAMPALMDRTSHLEALLLSLLGAGVGFGSLWTVVELGKKAFGKKRIQLDPVEAFSWKRDGDDAEFKVGTESMRWSEIFSRESDQLLIECEEAELQGRKLGKGTLCFWYNKVSAGGNERKLETLDTISGTAREITIPREAMGFGDVKFIAGIGAFLGWQAVFFTILTASIAGAFVGVVTILAGKREWSAKIPFGPYLALGALVWLFAGPELVHWYLNLAAPTP